MAHDLTQVNRVVEEALEGVAKIFQDHSLPAKAIVLNVIYEEGDVDWAVGSVVSTLPAKIKSMLEESLLRSAEEVDEAEIK